MSGNESINRSDSINYYDWQRRDNAGSDIEEQLKFQGKGKYIENGNVIALVVR